MNREKSISILKAVIKAKRSQVITILVNSGILLPQNPSNELLFDICMRELDNKNIVFAAKLATLIDEFFNTEQKSNFVTDLIGLGVSLVGGLIGGGGDGGSAAIANAQLQASREAAARQAALQKQLTIAASNAEAERLRYEAAVKKRKSATTRTIATISIIGGTVLITGIIALIALRKKSR